VYQVGSGDEKKEKRVEVFIWEPGSLRSKGRNPYRRQRGKSEKPRKTRGGTHRSYNP
jgi:hypothetical protein